MFLSDSEYSKSSDIGNSLAIIGETCDRIAKQKELREKTFILI